MEILEVEVKFHLENPAATRRALCDLGAISLGRVFEVNHILDRPEQPLFQSGALLRLRQDKRAWLTFKSPPAVPDRQFKIRRELEVAVSDFDTTRQMLAELGFTTVRVYEKWRETFEVDHTHLCLDSLPYGDFLEIEGPEQKILALSAALGFAWDRRCVMNYHELFELVKQAQRLDFTDITFANFRGVKVDMGALGDQFEAGE